MVEYSVSFSKTSGSLWQYCRDEPDDSKTDYKSYKCKSRLTNNTINDGAADVEVAVSLEYLGHFWEPLNCP